MILNHEDRQVILIKKSIELEMDMILFVNKYTLISKSYTKVLQLFQKSKPFYKFF